MVMEMSWASQIRRKLLFFNSVRNPPLRLTVIIRLLFVSYIAIPANPLRVSAQIPPLALCSLHGERLFLIREGITLGLDCARQDLFDAPFDFRAWQQDASATLLTAQADIGAQAHHLPIRIPTGMLLAQAQAVP